MAAVLLPCTIIVSCQRGRERSLRCDGCLLDRISLALSLPTALLPWPTEAGGRYTYISQLDDGVSWENTSHAPCACPCPDEIVLAGKTKQKWCVCITASGC
jgi:hypothetical protein